MRKQANDEGRPMATSEARGVDAMSSKVGQERVSRIPVGGGLSFLMSVYLYFSGSHEQGIFVGIWVPSILGAGALLMAGERS
jgi:hypothetical protein